MTVFSSLEMQVSDSAFDIGSLISIKLVDPRQCSEETLSQQSGHDYCNRKLGVIIGLFLDTWTIGPLST